MVFCISMRLKALWAAALASGAIFVISLPMKSVAPRNFSRNPTPSSCASMILDLAMSRGKSTANSCGGTYGHFG